MSEEAEEQVLVDGSIDFSSIDLSGDIDNQLDSLFVEPDSDNSQEEEAGDLISELSSETDPGPEEESTDPDPVPDSEEEAGTDLGQDSKSSQAFQKMRKDYKSLETRNRDNLKTISELRTRLEESNQGINNDAVKERDEEIRHLKEQLSSLTKRPLIPFEQTEDHKNAVRNLEEIRGRFSHLAVNVDDRDLQSFASEYAQIMESDSPSPSELRELTGRFIEKYPDLPGHREVVQYMKDYVDLSRGYNNAKSDYEANAESYHYDQMKERHAKLTPEFVSEIERISNPEEASKSSSPVEKAMAAIMKGKMDVYQPVIDRARAQALRMYGPSLPVDDMRYDGMTPEEEARQREIDLASNIETNPAICQIAAKDHVKVALLSSMISGLLKKLSNVKRAEAEKESNRPPPGEEKKGEVLSSAKELDSLEVFERDVLGAFTGSDF